jgi:hypothetical protein
MVSEIEIYLVLITAFAVPSIMAFVSYIKRGSTTETKEAIADMVIKSIQREIEELKNDLKGLVKSFNEVIGYKDRIMSMEERLRIIDTLDRDLVSIKLRLSNIEEKVKSIHNTVGDKRD